MQIKFCGAAETVTGSSHLLTLDDGFKILLDCGLYQGGEDSFDDFNEQFLFDPASIDVVILSHAHIDHCGKLPKLVKDGFKGIIYSTAATQDLTAILLLDSAHIQERESEFTNRYKDEERKKSEPLYTAEDVTITMQLFQTFSYNKSFGVHPDVDIIFKDSGHILGSASITLKIRRQGLRDFILGFTADIGRPNRPILRDPDPMPACDYLICESTYGDRLHASAPDEKNTFLNVIKHTCIEKQGALIIPAFSVGRTQEIVYMLDQLEHQNLLPNIPVFVDSPLAINATGIFLQHPECYDKEILKYMLTNKNPFGFNGLKYVRTVDESKKLNKVKGCIIISASGMINAGRVKHHVFNHIEYAENTILIVGYCSPNTPGGALRNGNKTIKLFRKELQVNAEVVRMESFSAHGDYAEMIDYLHTQDKQKLRNISLVHGDKEAMLSFKNKLITAKFNDIHIPQLGESITL